MSTLRERRDVFWKAKARKFAKQCNAEAHRRRKAEIKASDAVGCRKSVVKQLRIIRRFARVWKIWATRYRNRYDAQYTADGEYQEVLRKRITELEYMLREFRDQPHACTDRSSSVTVLECVICTLQVRARELLKKLDD